MSGPLFSGLLESLASEYELCMSTGTFGLLRVNITKGYVYSRALLLGLPFVRIDTTRSRTQCLNQYNSSLSQ